MPVAPYKSGGHASRGAHAPEGNGASRAAGVLRTLAQALLLAIVVAPAWMFGGILPGVQVWLAAAVVVAAACWAIEQFLTRRANVALAGAAIPLLLTLVLGAIQLLPLDNGVASLASPGAARIRGDLLPGGNSASAAAAETSSAAHRHSLSLYPASTRRDLAYWTLVVTVFVLAAAVFRTRAARLWMLGIVACNGAVLGFLDLVATLKWTGLSEWGWRNAPGFGNWFGPFVNRNHAGAYLNLCLAAALGLVVWALGRFHASDDAGPGRLAMPAPLADRGLRALARVDAVAILVFAAAGLTVAGVLCSFSRGAIVSTGAALAMTMAMVWMARPSALRLGAIALVTAAGVGLIAWIGLSDSLRIRLKSLSDYRTAGQARLLHWSDGFRAAQDFRLFGSGLGTYRYVYRPYQQQCQRSWFYHAENQYLEALVEGGVSMLALLLAAAAMAAWAGWRLLRSGPSASGTALAVAGLFALWSQLIHSACDFALFMPANALLLAMLCGVMCGRAEQTRTGESEARAPVAIPRWTLRSIVMAALLLAMVWSWNETRSVAAAENSLRATRVALASPKTPPQTIADAIDAVSRVLKQRPDDADLRLRLADLWVQMYRVRALEQLKQETPSADMSQLWNTTSPDVIYAKAHVLSHSGQTAELERLRREPVIWNHLSHAIEHLLAARSACPLMVEAHLGLAQLSVLSEGPMEDAVHLERIERLAAGNPALLFRCGVMKVQAGRLDQAAHAWQRTLLLDPDYLPRVLLLAESELGPARVARDVLPPQPALLLQLARDRYTQAKQPRMHQALLNRMDEILADGQLPADQQCYYRASLAAMRGHYDKAIASYKQALELRPLETAWRFELASLLYQRGVIDEAHEQARTCARADPHNRVFRNLLEEVNRKRLLPQIHPK